MKKLPSYRWELFSVEKILGNRIRKNGKEEYLLKWKDYPESHNSWETEDTIYGGDLMEAYKMKQREGEGSGTHTSPPPSVKKRRSDKNIHLCKSTAKVNDIFVEN